MNWTTGVAELVDWFLIHLDEWTEPTAVCHLHAAGSGYTKAQITAALKHLYTLDLIYKHHEDGHSLVYWLPVMRRPRCAIQEYLCKGRLE